MTMNEKRLSKLFEELVPASGKANTLAGEIVRAINRIGYRFMNDGDQIGVCYGNETCNAPARFLAEKCDEYVEDIISKMWGCGEDMYESYLEDLEGTVLEYLDAHPELKTTLNTEDMWDWYEKEDADWEEEDEDY